MRVFFLGGGFKEARNVVFGKLNMKNFRPILFIFIRNSWGFAKRAELTCSGVSGGAFGEGVGAESPDVFHQEIFADQPGK